MYKVLVDSNIFVDFMLYRLPFYDNSSKVISYCEDKKIKGYVTTTMLMDLRYIFKHYSHSNIDSNNAIKNIMNVFDVIDVSEEDINASINEYGGDFEDIVIQRCSERNKLDYIVTRNIKDFSSERIKIITPEELIKLMNNKQK